MGDRPGQSVRSNRPASVLPPPPPNRYLHSRGESFRNLVCLVPMRWIILDLFAWPQGRPVSRHRIGIGGAEWQTGWAAVLVRTGSVAGWGGGRWGETSHHARSGRLGEDGRTSSSVTREAALRRDLCRRTLAVRVTV